MGGKDGWSGREIQMDTNLEALSGRKALHGLSDVREVDQERCIAYDAPLKRIEDPLVYGR